MNEIEENILSVLNAFSSSDNKYRREAENLYSDLENKNPAKMVSCLIAIIKLNKNTFEALSALIKLGNFIESSAIRSDCKLPPDSLSELRSNFLAFLVDPSYPEVTRSYIMSVLEDFIYITSGNESDWPELIPFFLSLLETDDWSISITFFTYFLIVQPTDDFNSIVQSKIQFSSPKEKERAISLKFVLISLFNCPTSNNIFIAQIPTVLASLNSEFFSSSFSLFWKIFKKNKKLFSSILADICGLLLTNVADHSNHELFRRDSLFFFREIYCFSKKCRKIVQQTIEITTKIISSTLQFPALTPDLYEEAENALAELCDEKIAENYVENPNFYISSFYIFFFSKSDKYIDKIFENLNSEDIFIYRNGLLCLRKKIEDDPNYIIGNRLFKLIEISAYSKTNSQNSSQWQNYIEIFNIWCKKASQYDVEPLLKKMIDVVSSNDAYHLLYSASIICAKCQSNSKFVLKKITNRIMKTKSIDAFQLSIISNTYQCVNPIVSQESFKEILPYCLKSLDLLNSTPFLEIMEFIGYKFVPFLDSVISTIFSFSRQIENTLTVLDCFEKIVSLFNKNINDYIDSILKFALQNGVNESNSQIRNESITLINLILQKNWESKEIADSCLKYLLSQVANEPNINCFDSLLSIMLLFVERKKDNSDLLQCILSYVPFIISKAVESNSEELFISCASIFLMLLKGIPTEATSFFFQLQKIIPHYTVSPYDGIIKRFSLILWTDFVSYGPIEQTQQYLVEVVNDLKFYAEKDGDESFRKVAIICLYSYYTSVDENHKFSELEIESVFEELFRIASNKGNSKTIVEIATSAFAVVLQKYINEKIFILRAKQLVSLLPIKSCNDESDSVYNVIFELAVFCSKNSDLFDFFEPLRKIVQEALESKFVTESMIEDITQKIFEDVNNTIPQKLKEIVNK